MFKRLDCFLASISRSYVIFLTLVLVMVLGLIDYFVGPEISLSVFYSVPVAISTWYYSRTAGLIVSSCAAAAWLVADITAGHLYSSAFIPFWNSVARLVYFIIISVLLSVIRNRLIIEERLADTDYLTNLKNRRAFYEHVESESERSKRYTRPFTIAYIDLDNFKYVNDTMGHDAGDVVLKTVGQTIRNNIRHSDIVSRLGGDEFAGLFIETSYEAAESIVRNLVPHLNEAMKTGNWPITFSIGMMTFTRPMESPREMIKAVDDLMYSIKRDGKNNIIHKEWY